MILHVLQPSPDFFWGVLVNSSVTPTYLTGLVHHTWTAELRSWLASLLPNLRNHDASFAVDFNSIFPNFHPA